MIVRDEKILQGKSTPVESYEEGMGIVAQLLKEVARYKDAAGLSAIQIGIPKNVFIYWDSHEKNWISVINPEIVEFCGGKVNYLEGCLSFPGIAVRTSRYAQVMLQVLEEDDELHKYVYTDFEAVVVQHEIDHLQGILMFSHRDRTGDALVSSKIARNAPCPCGKKDANNRPLKYKKCCGK